MEVSGGAMGALVVAAMALIAGPLTAVIVPGPQGPVGPQGEAGPEGRPGSPGPPGPEPVEDAFVIGHVVVGNCTGPDGTGPFHLRVHAVNIGDVTARNVTFNVIAFVAVHDTSTGSTHPHSQTYDLGAVFLGDIPPLAWRKQEVILDQADCNIPHSSVDAEVSFLWD